MTTIEIVLLIGVCLTPIVALLFVVSKKHKKEEVKQEVDKQPETTEEKKECQPEQPVDTFNLNSQDFSRNELKDYMVNKSKSVTRPFNKSVSGDFPGLNMDFPPRRIRNEEKPVSKQIQDLSPELKALMIAGVLDKKDYSEY